MALKDCIAKFGKALDKRDIDAITALVDGGLSETEAVDRHLMAMDPRNLYVAHNLSVENLRHADELGGLAAPSLAVGNIDAAGAFESFGEITLLARPELLDSPKVRTFDADVYSPRHPRPEYDIDDKKFNELIEHMSYDAYIAGNLRMPDISELDRNGPDELIRNDALLFHWLKHEGKAPKLKKLKIAPWMRKALKLNASSTLALMEDPNFHKIVAGQLNEELDTLRKLVESDDFDQESVDRYERLWFEEDGTPKRGKLQDFAHRTISHFQSGGMDSGAVREALYKKSRQKSIKEGYENFVIDLFNDMNKRKRLFKGFTPSGNRKYIDYNLENIVKEMTKTLQGGEGFSYGAGSVRSAFANEMKTKAQIQAKRDSIVSEKEMNKVREESNERLTQALDELRPFYKFDGDSWGYSDDASNAIAEGPKGWREAFEMTDESRKIIADLITYLENLPTEYFEAKAQREVDLSEFDTALVPKGVSKDIIDLLKNKGVKIKRYDPSVEGSREEAIRSQERLLFQEPEKPKAPPRGVLHLLADGQRLIQLGKKSDPSTFLHETAHLFLEMERQFAAEFGITEDQQAILDWLGVDSFSAIKRDHHEKFAETFEVYLEEGKAPSLALRDAFSAFRRWLSAVYRSFTNRQRAELTPEIREVFDRLLATEAEIQQATANPAFDQFFRSQEQAGMTDAEWEAYEKQAKRAKSKAQSTIDEKIIKELRHRKTQEWKEEKAPLIEEEKDRLSKLPTYAILKDAAEAPMDHHIVAEINGGKIPGNMIGKTRKDGVDPGEYAEVYGFDTVKEMIEAIKNTPPLKKAADEAAENRMVSKYGDMLNDGTIEMEARDAIHNDEQAKLLLAELKALGRKVGAKQTIDREYLKAEAKRMIEGMTYAQISPSKYYRAEIRAAKKVATASNEKEAYEAKVQQIANHYLYQRSVLTKAQMEKHRKYVRRVQTKAYSTKEVEPRYIQNMKAIANLYDLRQNTERVQSAASILEWYETQINDPNQFIDLALWDTNLIAALAAKKAGGLVTFKLPTFDQLTAEGMHGLYDQLRHLRFVGGQMSDAVKAEIAAKRMNLATSVIENGGDDVKGVRGIPEKRDTFKRQIAHLVNKLPSLRNMMRKLDGFDEDGIAYELIYRDVEQANSKKINTQKEMYERFETELRELHRIGLTRNDAVNYTLSDGSSLPIHSEARFMMAVYWGTESSREAVRQGYAGITDDDVMRILSDMTKEQLQVVNAVWKVNESLWPELSSASVKQYGVAPPKLDATPFTVNGVTMTGGHQRLFYDSTELELKSEEEKGGSQFSVMPTKAGSLHSRVGSGGRPPQLDIHNITRAMDDTIHFISFAETGNRIQSFVNATEVKASIERKHGVGFYRAMIESIISVTGNRQSQESLPALAGLMRLLRKAATFKHLAYSIRNTVQQISAIPIAMEEVGFAAWSNAAVRFHTQNGSTELKEFVNKRSAFMNDRASLVNREASEYMRKLTVEGEAAYLWQQFANFGFTPQTIVDSLIAYPTWLAKYEQGMADHGDDKKAASQADTAVAESVGSGSDLHLGGAFQSTASEFQKTFTLFGSWFNAYYQRVYKSTEGMSTLARREAVYSLITTPFIVAVMSAALIMDLPDEDDETYWEWALKRYGAFMAGTIPVLRDIVGAFSGFAPSTVWSGGGEAPARLVGEIEAYAEGRQTGLKTVSDVTKVVTTVVPVPGVGNLTRVMDYMDSYNRGNEGRDPNFYQAIVEGADKN